MTKEIVLSIIGVWFSLSIVGVCINIRKALSLKNRKRYYVTQSQFDACAYVGCGRDSTSIAIMSESNGFTKREIASIIANELNKKICE